MWKDTKQNECKNTCGFEVVESLQCVLDNEGSMVDSRVVGTVFANCDVDENPEISILFKTIFPISDRKSVV